MSSFYKTCYFQVFSWRHDIQHDDIQYNDIRHNDIQHNDIQHNDIQHSDTQNKGVVYDTEHNWHSA